MTSPDYATHFSDRNVPFGIASSVTHQTPQAATRLCNFVLYLADLAAGGFFSSLEGLPDGIFTQQTLNDFAALPRPVHNGVRGLIQGIFRADGIKGFPKSSVEDVSTVIMHLPVKISDFADFSCSLEHVKNAGRIVVKSDKPPPAFFNFPTVYQGRASSVVVSGTEIERPMGQYRDKSRPGAPVVFGPSRQMDYELEFAAIVGKPLPMRQRLKATEADNYIFGFVVLNDWSARDIQSFEMFPLGPALGKSSGTSISPWIVTIDALEPFKVSGVPERVIPIPTHLQAQDERNYSVRMQVEILTVSSTATVTGVCDLACSIYWTVRQMAAHIASAGSAMRTGDILATGTVSGPGGKRNSGCLLEATEGGTEPLRMSDGSTRGFLEDGDVVRMTAFAGDEGSGVGWGECVGRLVPARPF